MDRGIDSGAFEMVSIWLKCKFSGGSEEKVLRDVEHIEITLWCGNGGDIDSFNTGADSCGEEIGVCWGEWVGEEVTGDNWESDELLGIAFGFVGTSFNNLVWSKCCTASESSKTSFKIDSILCKIKKNTNGDFTHLSCCNNIIPKGD